MRKYHLLGFVLLVSISLLVLAVYDPGSDDLPMSKPNLLARDTGLAAKIAEEIHYQSFGETGNTYTNRLADLVRWDRTLTEAPEVTFTFGACNTSGYTFTTTHRLGDRSFEFTE